MKSAEFVDAIRVSSSPEVISGLVSERVKDLESGVEPIKFISGGDKITYKYIHPESAVKAYPYSKGFRVNDDTVHEQFATEISHIAERDIDPDRIVLNASMLTTIKYFAQFGNEKKRRKIHGGLFRGKVQDLSAIRENGAAMCVEMAAVAHNLNMIGGVASAFMIGVNKTDSGEGGHAWQLVRQGDENMVFDVSHTVLEKKDDGITAAHPFLGRVDAVKLLMGEVATIEPDLPEAFARRSSYLFRSFAPTTFEEFAKLTYMDKVGMSEMSEREITHRSIVDTIIQFEVSDFYHPERLELPAATADMSMAYRIDKLLKLKLETEQ